METSPPERAIQPRRIMGREFLQALMDEGIISPRDYVSRVVIDASMKDPVTIYVERTGDKRLLNVATTLKGAEIRYIRYAGAND